MSNLKTLSTLIFTLSLFVSYGQQAIIVDHNGTPSVFQELDSAIAFASNGDEIYLSGGTWTIGNLTINKRLSIYGAGHDPDSTTGTGRTHLNGDIIFTTGSQNSFLTGVYLNGDIEFGTSSANDDCDNIHISRVNLGNINLSSWNNIDTSHTSGLAISESIIRSRIFGGNSNINVYNSFIYGQLGYLYNSFFENCVFVYSNNAYIASTAARVRYAVFYLTQGNSPIITQTTFKENIFRDARMGSYNTGLDYFSRSCSYIKNAFSLLPAIGSSNSGLGNISGFSTNDFENYNGNFYLADLRIKTSSSASGIGDNNSDPGIEPGAVNGFKIGSLPINPSIRDKSIQVQNNSLLLQVTVEAQSR